MATTKYNIHINKELIWDYHFDEDEYNSDYFFKWYLTRILNNGTIKDIKNIPIEAIKKNFTELTLSSNVHKFWEWYLSY
jgi:hypothetical protein